MSPENDTPQHDDEPTAELIIAKQLWARSNPGGWPEFGSVAITYANKARELVNELKAAGFEITKRSAIVQPISRPGETLRSTNIRDLIGCDDSDWRRQMQEIDSRTVWHRNA